MSDPFENKAKSGIKSIQRGLISGSSATTTITPVVTSKTELRLLGFSTAGTDNTSSPRIALTNSTTITMNTGGNSCTASWELTEWN